MYRRQWWEDFTGTVWDRDRFAALYATHVADSDVYEHLSAARPTPKGLPRIFHWGQDRRAEGRERSGSLGEGAAIPSPPPRWSGEHFELSKRGSGGVSTARRFSTIFSTQNGLS